MVGRAFLDALRFGATGGAVLGVAFWALLVRDGFFAPVRENLVVGVVSLPGGAAIGLVVAYVTLLLASMATDLAGRTVGVLVAFLLTFGLTFTLWRLDDPTSLWLAAPIGIASYGAVISWLRIPKILAQ